MTEVEQVTTTVQIVEILPGNPPRIVTGKWLHKQGNSSKFFQQMVPMPNAALFDRFMAQVCKGDTVQVTITTEWHEQGYAASLMDFVAIPQSLSVPIEELAANDS